MESGSYKRKSSAVTLYWQRNSNEPHHRKRTFRHVPPAKIQISLGTRAIKSVSCNGQISIASDAKFLNADNKDSVQTARMSRLRGWPDCADVQTARMSRLRGCPDCADAKMHFHTMVFFRTFS